ncbi:MAG: DNA glycosylase AlkZ-like family protein, partial [Gaiellaceae bacterium]
TFLVDGVVAGTWRAVDGRVAVEPFAKLSTAARREVDEGRERLEAFL